MRLRTLGGLELDGSGFSRPKPLLLLAYLALEGAQERRHLAELFWTGAADPLKSLSVALAQLRSGAPGCVEADRHRVRATVEIDATRLVEALAAGRPEEAVRQRARAIRPDLPDDPATLRAVAEVCRRLDGLPLAIELAAARVRVFSPASLAERIAGRLDLVGGGGPDLPERHRTLRQAIAWGHDLLDPAEQRLLRRCSVFAGGFDAETLVRFGARLKSL